MRLRWFVAMGILAGLIGWCSGVALTDDEKPQDEPPAPEESAPAPESPSVPSTLELANQIRERNRLVEAHEVLKRLVGTWDVEWTLQMGQGEPLHGKGVKTCSLLYGGRFLMHEYQGAHPENRGMGLMGYNTDMKRYEVTWVNTAGNAIAYGDGHFDEHTGVFTMNYPKLTEVGTYSMRRVESWGQDGIITASVYGGSGRNEVLIKKETLTRRESASPEDRDE